MTLSVKHTEMGVKENNSPLCTYSSFEPGTATRLLRVKWADRLIALRQLVGYSFASTVDYGDGRGPVKCLRRELPDVWSDDPGLVCYRVEVLRGKHWTARNHFDRATYNPLNTLTQPDALPGFPNNDANGGDRLDVDWKTNVYEDAFIKADYKQVDYYVLPDANIDALGGYEINRFVSTRRDRSAKYLGLPGGTLYWVIPGPFLTDGRLIAFSTGRIEGQQTIYLKWWGVANEAIPFATIDAMVGKVNKGTFLGCPEGTLLYMPPKIESFPMAGGVGLRLGSNIEHTLLYVPPGHNKLFRSVTTDSVRGYYFVTSDGTLTEAGITGGAGPSALPGKFLYDYEDFSKVFNCSLP